MQRESVGPQLNFLLMQATIINCLDACQVLFKQKVPLLWENTSFSLQFFQLLVEVYSQPDRRRCS